jgi:hypothetical protein
VTTPGAERILTARQEAAAELKLDISDWRVKRYATLMVTYDSYQARLAAGADINLDGLLKLDAAMAEIRASIPPEPPTVTVTFVNPTDHAPAGVAAVDDLIECRRCHWKPEGSDRVTRCYRCGWRHGDDINARWKTLAFDPPPAIEAKVVSKSAGTRAVLPAKEVKPHPNDLPRRDPGSIHDQPGVPLKRYDEPWRRYGGTS